MQQSQVHRGDTRMESRRIEERNDYTLYTTPALGIYMDTWLSQVWTNPTFSCSLTTFMQSKFASDYLKLRTNSQL